MTRYRVFVDVVDPQENMNGRQLFDFVNGLLDSAKVEITPEMKKKNISVSIATRDNTSNGGITAPGWHVHDGYSDGCEVCKQGYADGAR